MKSIVVMTYYQLMHSIALALTFEEKPMLYFSCDYLKADEDLILRIRESNIFHEVVGMSETSFIVPFVDELRAVYGKSNSEIDKIGTSIFEKYLEPYYAGVFRDADIEDEIYVYNDFQRHFYYIAKHFGNIIGVEDGYKSLEQQIRVHRFKGRYKLVEPFIDKYYPAPLYKNKNIKKIISSVYCPDVDQYYKSIIEVLDFVDLIELHKPEYIKALLHIFRIEKIKVKDNSTLYLGQPMSRGLYCTAGENYLFHRKVIREAINKKQNIYIKPHPADVLDYNIYRNPQIEVLPKEFPLEVLGYTGNTFDRSVSFGSTSAVDDFVKENTRLYTKTKGGIHDVRKFIIEYIADQKLEVNFYLKAKELTPRAYVNLYGYVKQHQFMNFNITVLIDESLGTNTSDYFKIENIKHRVNQYRSSKKVPLEKGLFELEIMSLPSIISKFPQNTTIQLIETSWETDFDIYKQFVMKDEFDYFMIADLEDSGIGIMKDLVPFLNKNICAGIFFSNYTYKDKERKAKIYLGMGSEVLMRMRRMSNCLLHRSICPEINQIVYGNGPIDLLKMHSNNFIYRPSLSMYVNSKEYQNILDGEQYYAAQIQSECDHPLQDEVYSVKVVSMLLKDYHNWGNIHYLVLPKDFIASILTKINCKTGFIISAVTNLAETLLNEQRVEHNKIAFKFEAFYTYSKDATEMLIRGNWMLRAQKNVQRRKIYKNILKKCRGFVSGIAGEDRARKLEETALLRKLYHIVTKKEREVK
jgi:hypothetical protein